MLAANRHWSAFRDRSETATLHRAPRPLGDQRLLWCGRSSVGSALSGSASAELDSTVQNACVGTAVRQGDQPRQIVGSCVCRGRVVDHRHYELIMDGPSSPRFCRAFSAALASMAAVAVLAVRRSWSAASACRSHRSPVLALGTDAEPCWYSTRVNRSGRDRRFTTARHRKIVRAGGCTIRPA